ncbi:hypothetical protein UFOVP181_271 [uncultured Caudovirales phage]|uniref:Cytidyltransferase-like domain-containing protein n=1 Tax=uncultured Caudovirales phage TaxID=2100421 RepID=A0A6J7WL65_9CAUD|nr:hypothetical protein UFOVP57_368 [uncultured Caudovirales phage]CAB5208970.1 hypothetical protein UFOVP181_271 [uncultured Caudovirales phage]
MKLRELFEAPKQGKHVTFCFGRMNPPHYGHGSLIKRVAQTAGKNDWFIFTSKSQDPKKNPLPYNDKLSWLHTLFPQLGKHLVPNPEIKTFLQAAAYLYSLGYTSATFVAGDEDMALMQPTLEKYNGIESKHGVYNFKPLQFVENPRETSATSARQAAIDGNEEAFAQATQVPSDLTVNGLTLFQAVRQGMGLADVPETQDKALAESNGKMRKRDQHAQRGIIKMRDVGGYDRVYHLNRIMMAAGMSDGTTNSIDMDPASWVEKFNSGHPFTEEEYNMLKSAMKVVPTDGTIIQKWSKSQELPHTNTTSPTAKPKKNKYGV